ncbi:hypothetical protein BGZ61DRAFT_403117 [Ilyonectria robusta]|uniref:uncharacterized protein n=1 Tax=Ilyonectria robusta TaxID=1079257 RepID=UPI001E8CF732|nr:uncharacterized protein BGZ61DRAFT_403117 [Ilyonectria robusta]KAH8661125.1 hypothetical protein BGZ61DRAFT_403117 [Ilyonectria robusta]
MSPASAQTNFLPGGYACGYGTNSLGYSTWPSPNTEYTPMASARSPRDSEHSKSHRDSSGSRSSSKHNGKNANKDKNSNKSNSKNKESKNDDRSNNREGATGLNSGGDSQRNKRIRPRNRTASRKFRVKKKEDALKLKSDEEEIERINRDLSSRVADLTHDVYLLEMQLLQHADCNCSMIQDYITHKAHRYVMEIKEPSPNEGHHQRT